MHAIGLVELSSIAKGIETADAMVKTAQVSILVSKFVCPGKYIVLIGGDVSSVRQSVEAGKISAGTAIVDQFIIPNVHPSILPALGGGAQVGEVHAVGVIETYTVAAAIEATDAAVKAAQVEPIRLHVAMGIGGKSYVVLTGEVADVQAAVKAGSDVAGEKGLLVQNVVIPRPHRQVIEHLV